MKLEPEWWAGAAVKMMGGSLQDNYQLRGTIAGNGRTTGRTQPDVTWGRQFAMVRDKFWRRGTAARRTITPLARAAEGLAGRLQAWPAPTER